MEEEPRNITGREIYDHYFGGLHSACMDIAIEEAMEKSQKYKIPLQLFDISALTYQHYRMWLDKFDFIEFEKKKKQVEIDKKFPPIIKNV